MAGETAYNYVQVSDFSGGLNLQDSQVSMADNQLQQCLNFILTRKGALKKRRGYDEDIAAAIGTGVIGVQDIYRLYSTTAAETIVTGLLAVNPKIYLLGSSSYTEITGGTALTYGADVLYGDYRDYLFLCNGSQFQYHVAGSGTKADVVHAGTTVTPWMIRISDDRIFAVDTALDRNTLYYTEFDGWTTSPGTDMNFAAGNDVTIMTRSSDSGGITNMWKYGNNDELLVFRSNDCHALMGVDKNDYRLVQMSGVAGCVAKRGIAETAGGDLIVVGNGTVYMLRGATFYDIGHDIRPRMDGVDMSDACAVYDQLRDCVLIGYRNGTLVWNVATESWSEFNIRFDCACRYTRASDSNKVLIGFNDKPYLYEYWKTKYDDGADILTRWQSKTFDLGAFYQEKFLRGIKTLTDAEVTTPFYVTVILNDGQSSKRRQMTITLVGSLWDTGIWDAADSVWASGNFMLGGLVFDMARRYNIFSILCDDTSHYDLTFYKAAIMLQGLAYTTEE